MEQFLLLFQIKKKIRLILYFYKSFFEKNVHLKEKKQNYFDEKKVAKR